MDPLTHALFGATAATLIAKRQHFGAAAICGIIAGMLPDADIVIQSAQNPLLQIEYHRHFTHALAFAPIGGLIAAVLCWILIRGHAPFRSMAMFCILAYTTHPFVDAATSWGTHLMWPFDNKRTSWGIVAIIDPFVTLTLAAGLIGCYFTKTKKWVVAAACLACLYLGFGAIQHNRAADAMMDLAQSRGHTIEHFEIKPTILNIILWRGNYISQGKIYNDAIRISAMGDVKIYPGGAVDQLIMQRDFPNLDPTSVQFADAQKFNFFADGFTGVKPDDPSVIGDFRFALLPQDIGPMWGIRIDPTAVQSHVQFESYRDIKDDTFAKFFMMLRGNEIN